MSQVRKIVLTALPKLLLSRSTGLLTRIPIPHALRTPFLSRFAKRYGADLGEMQGEAKDYGSLAEFFQRPLRHGARPIAAQSELCWPCDGKIITSGPIHATRIPQVKGRDYDLLQLLQDKVLAKALADGSQATIYLAPGDYHRVHSPFAAEILGVQHIPGALFPVNRGAVDSIPDLFPRNERQVFHCRLNDGTLACVVMVSALNVGDTSVTLAQGPVAKGQEIGRFGFGSTVIVLVAKGGPALPDLPREMAVRMGERVP